MGSLCLHDLGYIWFLVLGALSPKPQYRIQPGFIVIVMNQIEVKLYGIRGHLAFRMGVLNYGHPLYPTGQVPDFAQLQKYLWIQ